eukprot:GHUV01037572.1.p1 GENE.GHUV01037572.1~~GHUV01037572.1.p1  ORF type:complete len:183 (+),score=46.76 GHUV01037572.1:191-739(+)
MCGPQGYRAVLGYSTTTTRYGSLLSGISPCTPLQRQALYLCGIYVVISSGPAHVLQIVYCLSILSSSSRPASRRCTMFKLAANGATKCCTAHHTALLPPGVELLASGSKDCEVRIWDPATGSCLAAAAGHVAAVTAVAWSKSKAKGGKYLASGGADKLLKLWDTSKVLAAAAVAASEGEEGG